MRGVQVSPRPVMKFLMNEDVKLIDVYRRLKNIDEMLKPQKNI